MLVILVVLSLMAFSLPACEVGWFGGDGIGGNERHVASGLTRRECSYRCGLLGADGATLSTDGRGR